MMGKCAWTMIAGFFLMMVVGFLVVVVPQGWATDGGDVGSAECRQVQLAAQDAVAGGGPYKNHGALVATAAKVVSPAETPGEITAECASCIMNQFARGIAIADQAPCGGCAHNICTTGGPLDPACDPCVASICAVNSFCHTDEWDELCVLQTATVCGSQSCVSSSCDHNVCTTDGPLSPTCSACSAAICAADPFCCVLEWDSTCVKEVLTICGDPSCSE